MDIATLVLALKTSALTGAQIQALDSSYLCQNPAIALQQIRSCGYAVTTTTNADGTPKFQVTA